MLLVEYQNLIPGTIYNTFCFGRPGIYHINCYVLLTPFALKAGVNPWVIGIIIVASANVWTVSYQNTTHIAAMVATGKDAVKQSHAVRMSLAYMIINIIAIVASIPWWKILGLIP
ncbi:hypothetical protein Desgi_0483 [Desulfoscipio gibsoniae DSM 7213]|uniref:Uncharacterized protein n=1 Tax=Desulfoscipio gibsoniae DSM 7213 TaxID=767817 RepID=R4KHS6_9FIRM|nr:hypothetical protein Desgi_0483 [Desulfoscipio gibsoniae DSM 7213]